MKILFAVLLSLLLNIFVPYHLFSQCSGGASASSITYDTTVIGNGNASRAFSFPKFDPAVGTLIAVNLKSVVSLKYSYNLENQTSSDNVFKTRIVRTDDISADALDPSIDAVTQTPFVSSLIQAGHQLNYGPAIMTYTLNNNINDGRVVNFMGAGSVDFDYETGTSASVQGPLPWQLNFTSVSDTTHFSITYQYCAAALLSTGLMFFSAIPQDKNLVLLNWRQSAVDPNRLYNIELSTDGQQFNTVATIKENNTGVYGYNYTNSTSSKTLYFRIAQKNASGETLYSNLRIITFDQQAKQGVQVFPTLYTGGNLHVSFPVRGNWQINVYSLEGHRILTSHQNGVSADISLPGQLSNGVYIAEVTNVQTMEKSSTRIFVQR